MDQKVKKSQHFIRLSALSGIDVNYDYYSLQS